MSAVAQRPRRRGFKMSHARRESLAFYAFLSPWLIGFVGLTLGPLLASMFFSLTSFDAIHVPAFTGLENYITIAQTPLFWQALKVTALYIFATGKVGMTMGLSTQAYGSYKSAPFKWGIAPLPKQVTNKHSVFNGCWFIENDTKHLDASWEFLKYLTSDAAATQMSTATGFVAPLKTAVTPWLQLFEGPTGMKPADIQTVITDSNKNAVENVNHLFVGWTEISNTLTQSLSNLWLGQATAQDALTAAKGPVDAVLLKTYNTYTKKS